MNTPEPYNTSTTLKETNDDSAKVGSSVALLIIYIEICSAIFFGWFAVYQNNGWNGLILVYTFFPLLDIFSIWGIFKSVSLLKRTNLRFVPILLLVLSILSFAPPYLMGVILKPVIASVQNKNYMSGLPPEEKLKRQAVIDRAHSRYEDLVQRFQTPHIVSVVDDQYGFLILENGDIISPIGTFTREGEKEEFISWAKTNLINQQVEVRLPAEGFGISYCTDPDAANSGNQAPEEIRQKYNIAPDKGGLCNIMNAQVFYKGQSLEGKFK